jgi:hypothetical protein
MGNSYNHFDVDVVQQLVMKHAQIQGWSRRLVGIMTNAHDPHQKALRKASKELGSLILANLTASTLILHTGIGLQ